MTQEYCRRKKRKRQEGEFLKRWRLERKIFMGMASENF